MSEAFRDDGLLRPGITRSQGLTGDDALARAMADVEVAWAQSAGQRTESLELPEASDLAAHGEKAGNPVVPLLDALAEQLPPGAHRGLTSQDTLDTALMLLTVDAREQMLADADAVVATLADLAERHRDTIMVGRTLTQTAVPITFGLKVAQWLTAVVEARQALAALCLPVQFGGAAGTLALAELHSDSGERVHAFAAALGLDVPLLPWHTRRRPMTAVADAVTTLTDALGTLAADVALMCRPEIGELSEGTGGTSSTMPHKSNPVLSVLIRSAALQAPSLAAGLHVAAAQMVDERPDGAWHAQWPLYRDLLTLGLVATSQAKDLVSGLVVHDEVMKQRAQQQAAALLAEKYGVGKVPEGADPSEYLGRSALIVNAAVAEARAALPRSTGRVPTLRLTQLAGDENDPDVLVVGAGLGTRASTLWADVAAGLDGVQVVGVDLPGHGASPGASAPFTVGDLTEGVRQAVEPLAASGRRLWYAGVSLAGAMGLELATDPGPFSGVLCLASASRLGTPQGWRERAELVRNAGTPVMVSGSSQRWFAPGFSERRPDVVGVMLHNLSDVDDESYALCCEALAEYDLTDRLGEASVPVVLAPGEADVVVTVDAVHEDGAALPDAQVLVIGGAGHQPPVEAVEDVIAAVRDLMEVRS